jgi:small-conductance mechanosensitive channel
VSAASPSPLGELIQALAEGLARPRHAWAAAVIALALLGAWVLSRVLVHLVRRGQQERAAGAPQAAADAGAAGAGASALVLLRSQAMAGSIPVLRQLLFPFLALALLWIGEGLLRWRHVIASAADARLLRLAMFLVGAVAAVRVLFALLRRVFRHSALTAIIERVIAVAAVVGVGLYATGAWDDVVAWLASTEIPLGTASRVSLWSILVGGTTTLVSLLGAMWLGSLIDERLDAQTALAPNLRTVLGRVARALLLVIALLLALALSGIDLTVLSVFGGALGVGLGLGLQRIASNYVSGFILLLDHSLRIGDMVTVDKYYGQVTQISTRYTVLRVGDGSEAIVPNEMLVSSPVLNLTLSDRRLALSVAVAVAPETDLPRACALLCEAARQTARVLAEPVPAATLKEIQGGNLLLEVGFWIGDPEQGRQNVQSDVAIAALQRFRAEGIRLAVPRGDFRLSGEAADRPSSTA